MADMKTDIKLQHAVIAVNRFGLGAKPGELQAASADPKAWLKKGLMPITFKDNLPSSEAVMKAGVAYREMRKSEKNQKNKNKQNTMQAEDNTMMESMSALKKFPRESLRAFSISYVKHAVQSNNSISWRLLDFFSNHFSVSASGAAMAGLSATLEREAIAPNLLGNFEDMLLAVAQHPAMIIYLNNEQSAGANSRIGKKRGKDINENLAREILELHTLGVNGGYSQADVIELAKGITGWSLQNPKKDKKVGFKYANFMHEPGTRTLLGKTYSQQGMKQGESMLRDLANHPSTAQYLCYKLARHFIHDEPPKSLVDKLVTSWKKSSGNIKTVMNTLIDAEESWSIEKENTIDAKLKTIIFSAPAWWNFFNAVLILGWP